MVSVLNYGRQTLVPTLLVSFPTFPPSVSDGCSFRWLYQTLYHANCGEGMQATIDNRAISMRPPSKSLQAERHGNEATIAFLA